MLSTALGLNGILFVAIKVDPIIMSLISFSDKSLGCFTRVGQISLIDKN